LRGVHTRSDQLNLQPITIIIADDHPIMREGLMTVLASDSRMQVVATASSFDELRSLVSTVHADILILDILGMGGSPLTVVERLAREQPRLAIVIYSSSVDLVPELLHAGAKGYVVKEEISVQLITAIQSVHAGQTFLSPIAQDYLLRYADYSAQYRLTPREVSVLKLLSHGLSTMAIGETLGIDPRTVQNYILGLVQKLGVMSVPN